MDYIPVNSSPAVSQEELTVLSSTASVDTANIGPQAIWGPVKSRLIPSTKKTLSKVFSSNVSDLTVSEYKQLRRIIEYLTKNPESRARAFELTGFNDGDLDFAEKFLNSYDSRGAFAKLVGFALRVSSDGKVSKQIGGFIQFSYEIAEIKGEPAPAELRNKLLRNFPNLLRPIWEEIAANCPTNTNLCSNPELLTNLDLNSDGSINQTDGQLGLLALTALEEGKL